MASSPAADTLAARLETVATLITAGLPTRAYAVDLGGFDTHAGQAPTHAALLGELDSALGDFLERVAGHKVTVRSVYGAILEGVLGVDAKDVLDSPPRPLDLV